MSLFAPDLLTDITSPVQVFFVDLLLAGDNALVIALFCRALPPAMVARTVAFGTAGAIALRLVLAFMATSLLGLPGVALASGLLLLIIAANLVAPQVAAGQDSEPHIRFTPSLLGAGIMVALLDVIMSLDNVLALVAVSHGSMIYLALGVLFSIPLLMSGTMVAVNLLRRHPWLVDFGGAVLGWIAGVMMVSDPLVAAGINSQAPALGFLVPAALAFFVFRLGLGAARPTEVLAPPVELTVPEIAAAPIMRALPVELVPDCDDEPIDEAPEPASKKELYLLLGLFVAAGAVILFLGVLGNGSLF